ncbi:MAG TPA: alpha-galactosidase [Anaerolinea thermolimosa]|uniref:Alpha-galactosidase n=1 Tax=Anaerolinea thermolimosa TaxID=229919 RepID=A0A3D1JIL5_9CHLR|nr:alpha-galactosidase [Anaerolinea thermolimosa]GAP05508.1 alpha-galactosidase [Anaerolinea thermolimosa]HCE18420.1 alpha-galactosidase [Anaerolinea thermolimosa]
MPIFSFPNSWIIETRNTGYATGMNAMGLLTHRYWGVRLPRPTDYPPPIAMPGWASFNGPGQVVPEEYPACGGLKYIDPCLKLTFSDGTRDTVLLFEEASTQGEELILHLHDALYPLRVNLHYRAHVAEDLIERWVTVENLGSQPVTLERIFSAQWHLPRFGQYRLTHLSGKWLDENHLQREFLKPGLKVLESRRITTSHHASPWFAIDRGTADEDQGEVWFGALAWSGNWKITAEVTDFDSTRINIGLNDWDFAWCLQPGEVFTTPSAFAGYTKGGFGAASRLLHDFIRHSILPHGPITHKVLYNSWEATTFDVDVQSQTRLAELAADMGIELFVVDDGWFQGRHSDNAGLGDWWPDPAKFPDGLQPLIRKVNDLGMDFGLWIEPEMVNPDSHLYRAHPDWVIHFPSRPRTEARNQLILNLARPDVQEYLIETLDRLLRENNIAFIKWDMNRNVSEPGWPDAPGDPRELWVRYVQGVYRVWGELRRRHPNVIWQSCSGGGGRADLGILHLADQVWVSDNTEATARLNIQEGFSCIFPASVMEAWVTDAASERIPLDFRFHVAMCGALGVGGNLLHWSEEERQQAAHWIALYKEIRPIVQLGDQFRLLSPQQSPFSAVQYMSKDRSEGVLFVFRTHIPEPVMLPPVRLRGLDENALYEIEGESEPRSGLAWMEQGVPVMLSDFSSTVLRIRRVS